MPINLWKDSEVLKLRKLAKKRVSSKNAAKAIGRNHGAVRFKAHTLGIRFRSIDRKD